MSDVLIMSDVLFMFVIGEVLLLDFVFLHPNSLISLIAPQ